MGAFVTEANTQAYSYCPLLGTTSSNPGSIYYPQAFPLGSNTTYAANHLAATQDGKHILSVANGTNTLMDMNITIPVGACPLSGHLPFTSAGQSQKSLGISATANSVNQVIASPASNLAFVTYTTTGNATGASLPYYIPSTSTTPGTPGTVGSVTLSGTATAPISGIFSPDQTLFFAGTSGDNLVHIINASTFTDTQTLNPHLQDVNGNPVPVEFLGVRPRANNQ
jgi:hypothetical protein